MTQRRKKEKPMRGRSPVPPPTIPFKDRKKEAKRKGCRGPVNGDAAPHRNRQVNEEMRRIPGLSTHVNLNLDPYRI